VTLYTQVDHVDFHVDKTVTAQPATVAGVGVDVSFDVVYDPSSVGDCRSKVTLTSSVGGDYVFPLRATCTLPKPQVCRPQSLYMTSLGLVSPGGRAATNGVALFFPEKKLTRLF